MNRTVKLALVLFATFAVIPITSGCERCGKTTARFPLVIINATPDSLDTEVFSEREERPSVRFLLESGGSKQVVVKAIVRCSDLRNVSPITGPTRSVNATIIVTARNPEGKVAVREVRARNDEIERIEFRSGEFRSSVAPNLWEITLEKTGEIVRLELTKDGLKLRWP